MRIVFTLALLFLGANGVFAQALVNFAIYRRAEGVSTRVYGPEPLNPSLELRGNSIVDIAPGSVVYTGSLLNGTSYTAELWGRGNSSPATGSLPAVESDLVLITRTSFRTGTAVGIPRALPGGSYEASVPFAPLEAGQRGTFQLRAYDNRGGTVNTWAAVLSDGNILRGTSGVFSPEAPLGLTPLPDSGGLTAAAPYLIGLTSFNIHTVPEPSVWALGVLGAAGLLWRRRR